jgi:hypothetical protein
MVKGREQEPIPVGSLLLADDRPTKDFNQIATLHFYGQQVAILTRLLFRQVYEVARSPRQKPGAANSFHPTALNDDNVCVVDSNTKLYEQRSSFPIERETLQNGVMQIRVRVHELLLL